MGIQLYDNLMAERYLKFVDKNLVLTPKGEKFVTEFGIDVE